MNTLLANQGLSELLIILRWPAAYFAIPWRSVCISIFSASNHWSFCPILQSSTAQCWRRHACSCSKRTCRFSAWEGRVCSRMLLVGLPYRNANEVAVSAKQDYADRAHTSCWARWLNVLILVADLHSSTHSFQAPQLPDI